MLSAYGLALANVVHEVQEPSARVLGDGDQHLWDRLGQLSEQAVAVLRSQGYPPERIRVDSFLNLRYQGTDCAIMTPHVVAAGGGKDIRAVFMENYKREFGFVLSDRELIVDDLRVRAHGLSDINESHVDEMEKTSYVPVSNEEQCGETEVYFDGGRKATPVYHLKDIKPGRQVQGPAILLDANSTILSR